MTPTLAIVLAIVAVVGGARALYSSFWGPRARARKRLARGTSQIEDHAVVTLTGTVRALTTIEAPLSGTSCVAFVVVATATYGRQYDERHSLSSRELVPFELVTSAGIVRVEASTADLAHPTRSIIPRSVSREASFLVAHGLDARMVRTSSFQQAVVVDGDEVRVQGLALVEQAPPSDAQGYRETDRSIRIVSHESHPLTIGPA